MQLNEHICAYHLQNIINRAESNNFRRMFRFCFCFFFLLVFCFVWRICDTTNFAIIFVNQSVLVNFCAWTTTKLSTFYSQILELFSSFFLNLFFAFFYILIHVLNLNSVLLLGTFSMCARCRLATTESLVRSPYVDVCMDITLCCLCKILWVWVFICFRILFLTTIRRLSLNGFYCFSAVVHKLYV